MLLKVIIGCPVHIEKFNGKEFSNSVQPPGHYSRFSGDRMECNLVRLYSKSHRSKQCCCLVAK